MNKSFEHALLQRWTVEGNYNPFQEPLLDEHVIKIIKLACDTLQQDKQVFFMTVDVAETYICLKEYRQEQIADPFCDIMVILFICSKLFGCGADLKVAVIEKFMAKITERNYHFHAIIEKEWEILKVLDCRFPTATVLDDFETFFERFARDYRLKDAILRPLCVEIAILVYCTKQKLFKSLKDLYKSDSRTYEWLLHSKFYLPAGILMIALKSTNYQFILDIEGLFLDVNLWAQVHPSHVYTLSSLIEELMNNDVSN